MRFGDRKRGRIVGTWYHTRPVDATERGLKCALQPCDKKPHVHVTQAEVRVAGYPETFVCCFDHLLEFLRDVRVEVDRTAPRW